MKFAFSKNHAKKVQSSLMLLLSLSNSTLFFLFFLTNRTMIWTHFWPSELFELSELLELYFVIMKIEPHFFCFSWLIVQWWTHFWPSELSELYLVIMKIEPRFFYFSWSNRTITDPFLAHRNFQNFTLNHPTWPLHYPSWPLYYPTWPLSLSTWPLN